ncbi:hypothetical protein D3C87_2071100 [compost metagenome]
MLVFLQLILYVSLVTIVNGILAVQLAMKTGDPLLQPLLVALVFIGNLRLVYLINNNKESHDRQNDAKHDPAAGPAVNLHIFIAD